MQNLQEEAHQAREALTKQLEQKMKTAENELAVSKLVSSLLLESGKDAESR